MEVTHGEPAEELNNPASRHPSLLTSESVAPAHPTDLRRIEKTARDTVVGEPASMSAGNPESESHRGYFRELPRHAGCLWPSYPAFRASPWSARGTLRWGVVRSPLAPSCVPPSETSPCWMRSSLGEYQLKGRWPDQQSHVESPPQKRIICSAGFGMERSRDGSADRAGDHPRSYCSAGQASAAPLQASNRSIPQGHQDSSA